MFGRIFTYFLFFMIFAGLGVSILTKDVLMVIADKKFWPAYKIVPIIVMATTIFSFHYHLNMGILIHKKTKYLAYINFSNGIFVLILNFLLIPRYGVYGAAYATLIAFIYKISLTYYFSSKYYKIHFEFVRIGKILLVSAVIYLLCISVKIQSIYISLIIKSFAIFTFPVLLLGIKFYTQEEKSKIFQIYRSSLSNLKRYKNIIAPIKSN